MNDFDYELPIAQMLASFALAALIGACLAIAFVA